MSLAPIHGRLVALPVREALGVRVPVATGFRSRLLGLSLLPRDAAGSGLLIPRCRSVHSFGMRFSLEVVFLDERGRELRRVRLPPRRVVSEPRADSVLEIPAARGSPGQKDAVSITHR